MSTVISTGFLLKGSKKKKTGKKERGLKKHEVEKLRSLIEMEDPDWVRPDIFTHIFDNIDDYCFADDTEFVSESTRELGLPPSEIHSEHGYLVTRIKASKLLEMYQSGRVMSSVFTGQDPKFYSTENVKHAATHAANHWGQRSSSWHQSAGMNFLRIPAECFDDGMWEDQYIHNGYVYILDCVDIEHRLWGIVGFQLDLVSIRPSSGENMYFEHPSLKIQGEDTIGRIRINGLRLSEIVKLANKNKKKYSKEITEEDVLSRFDIGSLPVNLFPMWEPDKTHDYYHKTNGDRDEKSTAQLLHSKSSGIIATRIKMNSSPKYGRSKSSDGETLPFFSNKKNYSDKERESLKPYMDYKMVIHMCLNGWNFVPSSDSKIRDFYHKKNGYSDYLHEWDEIEQSVNNAFFTLDEIFIHRTITKDNRLPPQHIQQVLGILIFAEKQGRQFIDSRKLCHAFYDYLSNNMYAPRAKGQGKLVKTEFGTYMGYSEVSSYEWCHEHLVKNLFYNQDGTWKSDDELFDKFGMVRKNPLFQEEFSESQIKDAMNKQNCLDIDGESLNEKDDLVEGGHIVSKRELFRTNQEERDAAAIREGIDIDGKFYDSENCMAISKYHNRRMRSLPRSIYWEIMHESDEVVNAAVAEFDREVDKRLLDRLNKSKQIDSTVS